MTSLAVVAGAGGVALAWPLADPLIGLLITILILSSSSAARHPVEVLIAPGSDASRLCSLPPAEGSLAGHVAEQAALRVTCPSRRSVYGTG